MFALTGTAGVNIVQRPTPRMEFYQSLAANFGRPLGIADTLPLLASRQRIRISARRAGAEGMAEQPDLVLNRARRSKTRNVSRRITELLQNLVGVFAVLRGAAHQAARRPAERDRLPDQIDLAQRR